MNAKFLTDLECKLVHAGWWRNTWELTAPLRYYSNIVDEVIEASLGFRLDFASVPRIPIIWWIYGGIMQRPAAIHDWIYRVKLYPRRTGDLVFREAVGVDGGGPVICNSMYAGVRLGGHWAYGRDDG